MKSIFSFFASAFLMVIFFVAIPSASHAADFYFWPSSGSHAVGDTLWVGVYLKSPDQAINAVSGQITFPADRLQALSVSKADSIVSLWVKEPSFSNESGSVDFEGVILNPGFTGASGKIAGVQFRVKKSGNASLSFGSALALANDGRGTNILTGTGSATFALKEKPAKEAPKPAAPLKPIPVIPPTPSTEEVVPPPPAVPVMPEPVVSPALPVSAPVSPLVISSPLISTIAFWIIAVLLMIIIILIVFIVLLIGFLRYQWTLLRGFVSHEKRAHHSS